MVAAWRVRGYLSGPPFLEKSMFTDRPLRVALGTGLLLALATAGCGGGEPIEPNEPADAFTLRFCTGERYAPILWVGQQNGNGAWEQLLPAPGTQTYRFSFPAGRGAIAIRHNWLDVYYASAEQLRQFAALMEAQCVDRTAAGEFSGARVGDTLWLSFGYANWFSAAPTDPQPFQFEDVAGVPRDLVAMARGNEVRYIIRPNLLVPNNSTIAPLDFNSAEAIPATHATLNVTGLRSDRNFYYTTFGFLGQLSKVDVVTTPATYDAVPAARLPDGRVQTLSVLDYGPPEFRVSQLHFREAMDINLAMGPSLSDPTVTVRESGAFAFPTMQLPVQAEYARSAEAFFMADTSRVFVLTTAEYATSHSTWTLTVPDLTALPGFKAAWMLPSGSPLRYDAGAAGDSRPWPFDMTLPRDGDRSQYVSRRNLGGGAPVALPSWMGPGRGSRLLAHFQQPASGGSDGD
jgi:hypothetical protein